MESLTQQIQSFTSYLETERDVSPHTLSAYRTDLSQLLAFAQHEKGDAISALDVDHLMLRRLSGRPFKRHQKKFHGAQAGCNPLLFPLS